MNPQAYTQAGMQSQGTEDQMPPQEAPIDPMAAKNAELDRIIQSKNLAENFIGSEEGRKKLDAIGADIKKWYGEDLASRKGWEQQNQEYMKLACQVMENKTYPWNNASNVKFPILTTAALQFSSRAYPSLVSGFDIVKAKAIGNDPEGINNNKAQTISTHMSYQLLYEMTGWDEDMDKLCFILPILGTCFKKTYYDPSTNTNKSELVLARDLVIDYWAKDLESAYRKTHRIFRTPNQIMERQRQGIYIDDEKYFGDVDLKRGGNLEADQQSETLKEKQAPSVTSATPRLILECHTFYDLDEDDYEEPYIITIDYESGKVLRIVARFYRDGIEMDKKKVVRIQPCEYFTKFGFLPNPDGGFYDLGFGLLLGGVNSAVNTLINQLIDAGTLANLQGGFISKGIRLKQGEMKFTPGEWKMVNNFGDDLKKGVFPLPVKEPSNVLLELLGTLAQSGKELASIAEIFTGKMPGQNTPASTTMATIEQGLKVFTAIYKRIYRSLGQEFEKLYTLNKLYLPEEGVEFSVEVSGENRHVVAKKEDYGLQTAPATGKPFIRIVPAADPNMVSETQKLVKAQGLLELINLGTINAGEATKQILEQQGQANIKQLMELPPPQPPLEIQLAQIEGQERDKDRQLEAMKIQSENMKRQSEIALNLAKAKELGDEINTQLLEFRLKQEEAAMEMHTKMVELMFKRENHRLEMQMKQEEHSLDMEVKETEAQLNLASAATMAKQDIKHNEESHKQKLVHGEKKAEADIKVMGAKAKAAAKAKPSK